MEDDNSAEEYPHYWDDDDYMGELDIIASLFSASLPPSQDVYEILSIYTVIYMHVH